MWTLERKSAKYKIHISSVNSKNDDWDIRIFICVAKDKECCAKIV